MDVVRMSNRYYMSPPNLHCHLKFYSFLSHYPFFHVGQYSFQYKTRALFEDPERTVDPESMNFSLGEFAITGLVSEEKSKNMEKPKNISVSVIASVSEVSSNDWDTCAMDTTGPENFNPFISHSFLSALEESGCAVKETGWMPQHIIARDASNYILGVVPLYLKSNSYGEFVFDHAWADAYYNYGLRYYPKLQCCVPFTPVSGPRILIRNTRSKIQIFDILVSALKYLADKFQVSSLHVTFPFQNEWKRMKENAFLQRIGMQYHWKNRNYKNFDEFLMDMKQTKRKNIRQERKKISAQNLTIKRLRGHEIKAQHWDSFYKFYRSTTDKKWGNTYLNRDFFHSIGSKMGEQLLLVVATEGDKPVAGALNVIGGDTLFGRLWGCLPQVYYPGLHFEACYYQAIEAAIEMNLKTVEAGAQGEHKIQRGYLPVTTYSSHYIRDPNFREAIEAFLLQETSQINHVMELLQQSNPFKDDMEFKNGL